MLFARVSRRSFRRSAIGLAGAGGLLVLSSSTTATDSDKFAPYTEPIRFSAIAAARSSRVVICALLCFKDYRNALKQKEGALSECHTKCAKRVLRVMEKNGGIYIKLGQHIAAMSYLLPVEWCETMMVLEDQCPPTPIDEVRRMFKLDTGHDLDDVFSEFDEVPLGVASLAQVHRAVRRQDHREVAVKFQHSALKEFSAIDLDTTRFSFQLIKRFFPEFSLTWLSEEMDLSLPQELDFAIEGRNAMKTREHFRKIAGSSLYVPEVLWAQPRILVMEFIAGRRVDDLSYLAAHGIDRNEVSAELARAFNEMIFFAPALHCDPHGGNVFVRPRPHKSHSSFNFEIVLLDHGLYREIPIETRRKYARLWLAIIAKDDTNMRKYSYEVAGVKDDKYPLFASAITGRDFQSLQIGISTTPRSADELMRITTAAGQGLLQQLVGLLSNIPRILLLLLKTNDLTRHLDESLKTTSAPERPFLILAQACNRVIYEEDCECARSKGIFMQILYQLQAVFRYWPRWIYLTLGESWCIMQTRQRLDL